MSTTQDHSPDLGKRTCRECTHCSDIHNQQDLIYCEDLEKNKHPNYAAHCQAFAVRPTLTRLRDGITMYRIKNYGDMPGSIVISHEAFQRLEYHCFSLDWEMKMSPEFCEFPQKYAGIPLIVAYFPKQDPPLIYVGGKLTSI